MKGCLQWSFLLFGLLHGQKRPWELKIAAVVANQIVHLPQKSQQLEFYQAPVQIKRMGQQTRRWLPVILNGPASLRAAPPLLSDLERGNFVIPFRCGTVIISRGLFQRTASYCVIYFLTALTTGIVYWGGESAHYTA